MIPIYRVPTFTEVKEKYPCIPDEKLKEIIEYILSNECDEMYEKDNGINWNMFQALSLIPVTIYKEDECLPLSPTQEIIVLGEDDYKTCKKKWFRTSDYMDEEEYEYWKSKNIK